MQLHKQRTWVEIKIGFPCKNPTQNLQDTGGGCRTERQTASSRALTALTAATISAGLKAECFSAPKGLCHAHSLGSLGISKAIFHSALHSEHRKDPCRENGGGTETIRLQELRLSMLSQTKSAIGSPRAECS